jgi:hypothetical protein
LTVNDFSLYSTAMKSAFGLVAILVFAWVPAWSSTIFYSDSGTFTASTPSTSFSGPSETWAFSFEADSNQTDLESITFSDFTYSLDGSPDAIMPTLIIFGSGAGGGGWQICFTGTSPCTSGLSTLGAGPQMYTGTASAPTLIPGAFTSTEFVVYVDTTLLYIQPNTTLTATASPEPSALLPLALGILALVGRQLYRRKRQTLWLRS